jgi:phosphatidylethanolamine/phosphatidyl-N-methylethanolamine N-methyltransferase
MSTRSILKAYRRYAGVYDTLFDTVFAEGRRLAVDLATRTPGAKVLEVGVGTGLSLPSYRTGSEVWGIDLSEPMLQCARNRVERDGLTQVKSLQVMNAESMDFADASFDAVVGMYVASVVGDPDRMFREMSRVCKPRGSIIVVNHFASTNWIAQALETCIAPLSGLIGFRSTYSLEQMQRDARMEVVSVREVNWFNYWRLVHLRNAPGPAQAAQAQAVPAFSPQLMEADPERA